MNCDNDDQIRKKVLKTCIDMNKENVFFQKKTSLFDIFVQNKFKNIETQKKFILKL